MPFAIHSDTALHYITEYMSISSRKKRAETILESAYIL